MAEAVERETRKGDVEEITGLVGEEISAVKGPANKRTNLVLKSQITMEDKDKQPREEAAGNAEAAESSTETVAPKNSDDKPAGKAPASESAGSSDDTISDSQLGAQVIELAVAVEDAAASADNAELMPVAVAKCMEQLVTLAPHAGRVGSTQGSVRAAAFAALSAAADASKGFEGDKAVLVHKSILKLSESVRDEDPRAAELEAAAKDRADMELIQKSFLELDTAISDANNGEALSANRAAEVQSNSNQSPAPAGNQTEAALESWLNGDG